MLDKEFSSMIVFNAIVIELENMIAELHWLGLTEFSCEVVNQFAPINSYFKEK